MAEHRLRGMRVQQALTEHPPTPWTLERVRQALGLRPFPDPFPNTRRVGRTTRMLCEALVAHLNQPKAQIALVAHVHHYAVKLERDFRTMLATITDDRTARAANVQGFAYNAHESTWAYGRQSTMFFDHAFALGVTPPTPALPTSTWERRKWARTGTRGRRGARRVPAPKNPLVRDPFPLSYPTG